MITIKLGEGQLPHIKYEKDGMKRAFHLDHNTLFQFLVNNCYETKTVKKEFNTPVFETPALPPGTVKYLSLPDGKVMFFMEHKQEIHDITYHKTKYKVPFPNLLFVFQFSPVKEGYKLSSSKCFCFKDLVFRETTKLYRFPFSHVLSNGNMCFFYLSEVKDLAQMTSFVHNWMAADFTDHYYNEKDVNKWGCSLREVFEQLNNKKTFDYSKLIPTSHTAEKIIQSTVNQYFAS